MVLIPGSVHGACTTQQARAVLGSYGLRVALARRVLTRLWRGALVDTRMVLEPRTRAAAALLAVGHDAVVSGVTALALHGCGAVTDPTVHLTTSYDRWPRRRPGLAVHQGRLSDSDIVEVAGIRLVALDLAVVDALCTQPRALALLLADQAMALHDKGEQDEFLAMLTGRLAERADRHGTRRGSYLLDLVSGAAESPPESCLRLLVVDAGFPVPAVQHEVCDLTGMLLYRLDLAWPQLRIGAEYDGYEAHVGREDVDASRQADLERRGWIIVRATAADLRNPRRFLDELAAAFRRRRAHVGQVRLVSAG
jgi:hypothetical protein